MAETFNELHAAYHDADMDERAELVAGFEDLLPNPEVIEFLVGVVANMDEYDLARIEALKVLQLFRSRDDDTHERIGNTIATVLKDDTDVLVRQWAAIALDFNYHDLPEVRKIVIERLLDADEEINTRHNCLSVIKRAH